MFKPTAATICVAFALSTIPASKPEHAGDCGATMSELLNHKGGIDLTLVSMNDNGVASYSKMLELRQTRLGLRLPPGSPPTGLRGSGTQQFNDRLGANDQPFNLGQSDDLQVDFSMENGNTARNIHAAQLEPWPNLVHAFMRWRVDARLVRQWENILYPPLQQETADWLGRRVARRLLVAASRTCAMLSGRTFRLCRLRHNEVEILAARSRGKIWC